MWNVSAEPPLTPPSPGRIRALAKLEADNRRQQRLRTNGPRDRIDKDEVAERDGWICGICGWPVDFAIPWRNRLDTPPRLATDPRFKTIDHVTPVAVGGTDTFDNVQLTHRSCNASKHYGVIFTRETARAMLVERLHWWALQEELGDDICQALRRENSRFPNARWSAIGQ